MLERSGRELGPPSASLPAYLLGEVACQVGTVTFEAHRGIAGVDGDD